MSQAKPRKVAPRRYMVNAVKGLLEGSVPMTTQQITKELYKSDTAYTVIEGRKCKVGSESLERVLEDEWTVAKGEDNRWFLSDEF